MQTSRKAATCVLKSLLGVNVNNKRNPPCTLLMKGKLALETQVVCARLLLDFQRSAVYSKKVSTERIAIESSSFCTNRLWNVVQRNVLNPEVIQYFSHGESS